MWVYFYLFNFSWLYCLLRFQNSPQTHLWEGFLLCGNFSFTTPSPGQVSVPNYFIYLFVFYTLSYLLLKRMGCLYVCLVSSAHVQKLICGSCSAFKWSFDEFVGEKVVSLSYSYIILGLPPLFFLQCGNLIFFSHQVYIYVWIWLWSFYCVLYMFCLSLLWFHIV